MTKSLSNPCSISCITSFVYSNRVLGQQYDVTARDVTSLPLELSPGASVYLGSRGLTQPPPGGQRHRPSLLNSTGRHPFLKLNMPHYRHAKKTIVVRHGTFTDIGNTLIALCKVVIELKALRHLIFIMYRII